MNQWKKGHVEWFDKSSGEGIVLGEDGEQYYVHYSSVVPKRDRTKTTSNGNERRNLSPGKKVKFTAYVNLYSKRVEKVEEI